MGIFKKQVKVQDFAGGESAGPKVGNYGDVTEDSPRHYIGEWVKSDDTEKSEENEAAHQTYIPGQGSPEDDGGYKQNRRTTQQRWILVGAAVLVVVLIVIAINDFAPKRSGTYSKINVEEQKLMGIMEENKKLREQIQLFQQSNNEVLAQLPKMVEDQLRKAMESNSVSGDITTQYAEKMRLMEAEQAKLKEQLAAFGTGNTSQTAVTPEPAPEPRQGSSSKSMVYTTIGEITAKKKAEQDAIDAKAKEPAPYDNRAGIPSGFNIPAVLKTMIISSTKLDRYQVAAETESDIEFMPGYVLPKGTRFLGKSTADFDARRILVDIEKLQFGTTEVNIKGIMTDHRGNPGMVTKYQDPLMQGIPMIAFTSLLSAAAGAAQDMTERRNVYGDSYQTPDFNGKNVALQGASSAMTDVSNILANAYAKKQPIIMVHNGIKVSIQISEKVLLDTLINSGIVKEAAR